MSRIALILVLALPLAACATTSDPEEPLATRTLDSERDGGSDSFLSNFAGSLDDHVEDCEKGLSFTFRSFGRRLRSDLARLKTALH